MQITDMISASNAFTDENVNSKLAVQYVNEAIAIINSKGFMLPFMDASTDYKVIPESWQRLLLCTWLSYGVKMNDTSTTEAMEYKSKFYDYLSDFVGKATSIVPPEYIGTENGNGTVDKNGIGGAYQINTSKGMNIGWFGRNNRGGN